VTLRIGIRALACASFVICAAGLAQTPSLTAAQLKLLRQQLDDSQARMDWQANLRYATSLRELLNGSPRSQLDVARAELELGKTELGLRDLTRFARMDQIADLAQAIPNISSVLESASLRSLQQNFEANRSEISRASLAFVLPDPTLLAEDIDYDARSRRFFISSVRAQEDHQLRFTRCDPRLRCGTGRLADIRAQDRFEAPSVVRSRNGSAGLWLCS